MKCFWYQISTSVKRSEKQLSSKAIFCSFLQLNCSNFRLKQCKRPWSYKNCQRYQVWRSLGRVKVWGGFPGTISHRVFGANSSVRGMAHCGRGLIAIFRRFFVSINKIFMFAGGLGVGLSFYGDKVVRQLVR